MLTFNQTSLFLQTFLHLANLQTGPDVRLQAHPKLQVPGADGDRGVRHVSSVNNAQNLITCYGIYGCFYIGHPWTKARPVNLFPVPPEVIKPTFCLYTQRTPTTCQDLRIGDVDSVRVSYLMPSKKVFIISHGYLENGNKTWIKRMVKELLLSGDWNVVVVDWSGGSSPPYTQAVANTRLVGSMTAYFIAFLKESFGVDPATCHFVGHSLGAHLAGYTGQRLQELGYKLGRITGMDPAEPHFQNSDAIVRLDPSDAQFVDVIHTDGASIFSGGLGLLQPSGHLDFYPNGGRDQPGCGKGVLASIQKEDGSLVHGLRRFFGCSHIRAYELFTESVNSKCPFLAVGCDSWRQFQDGRCAACGRDGARCARLGLHADEWDAAATRSETSRKMFLLTGSGKPFCKYHYQVTVRVSNTEKSIRHGGDIGFFDIKLHGDMNSNSVPVQLNNEEIYFEPGSVHTFMGSGDIVGRLRRAEVCWHYPSSLFNPLTWRFLATPLVYVSSITVLCVETQQRVEFCGQDLPFISEIPQTLTSARHCPQEGIDQDPQDGPQQV